MARKRITDGNDPVIRGCLRECARGNMGGAMILADYLEEQGHRLARRVRAAVNAAVERASHWRDRSDEYWARARKWTRWQAIAAEWLALRRRVAGAFGREWKNLTHLTTWRLNATLLPTPKMQGNA